MSPGPRGWQQDVASNFVLESRVSAAAGEPLSRGATLEARRGLGAQAEAVMDVALSRSNLRRVAADWVPAHPSGGSSERPRLSTLGGERP